MLYCEVVGRPIARRELSIRLCQHSQWRDAGLKLAGGIREGASDLPELERQILPNPPSVFGAASGGEGEECVGRQATDPRVGTEVGIGGDRGRVEQPAAINHRAV